MGSLIGIDLIFDNIREGKWWRLINLTGMTVKLKTPISKYAHPEFKGNPYYIKIESYVISQSTVNYNNLDEYPELWMYSDNVIYSNEYTPADNKHMINLSLLDFNYLHNLISSK